MDVAFFKRGFEGPIVGVGKGQAYSMFCHIVPHFLMLWHSIKHLQTKNHLDKIAPSTGQIKIGTNCSFSALLSPLRNKQLQSTKYCYLLCCLWWLFLIVVVVVVVKVVVVVLEVVVVVEG